MIKRNTLLFLLLLAVVLTGPVFAEEFSITSYYPSPYGSYRDLEAKKSLAVGDIGVSGMTMGDLSQGELWVEDSVIYRGRDSDPAVGKEGELIYNTLEDTFKYYNGSTWVAQGGKGCYVSYSGGCLAGFTNMGSLGWWGRCYQGSIWSSLFCPPGASCGTLFKDNLGEAFLCCD